ncbi:4'-phosphopantetheinyl transferase superfamily protein [Paenibacillus sp. OAE614]|uniref:4'-phosphopantetheinyl transferase family protein n=1 Tax=Paenibacillus sp. OAE614 TaxID=2663804 RepID=UPI00178B214B
MIKHIIAVNVVAPLPRATFNECLLLLNNEKRERICRFKYFEDAQRSLLGELLILYMIKKCNIPLKDISLSKNKYGKPILNGKQDFYFNISHSGRWVVGACGDIPLGIDIEEIKEIDISLMQNILMEDEYKELMKRTGAEFLAFFYDLWTYKESFIKAIGTGMSTPITSFSLYDELLLSVEKQTFKQYEIDKNYKFSICALQKNVEFPNSLTIISNSYLCKTIINSIMKKM